MEVRRNQTHAKQVISTVVRTKTKKCELTPFFLWDNGAHTRSDTESDYKHSIHDTYTHDTPHTCTQT